MITNNKTDVKSNFEIPLELNDKLKSEGIIERFVKNKRHKHIKIELNHKDEKINIVVSTSQCKELVKIP